MKPKSAFTMIELVFVIVILGILAGIAIPRLAVTRDDASVTKIRADIQAIRSGIQLKKAENLMKGDTKAPANWQETLSTPLKGNWENISSAGATVCIRKTQCATFAYSNTDGNFTCSGDLCKDLGE